MQLLGQAQHQQKRRQQLLLAEHRS
jgi:hypothetical protein